MLKCFSIVITLDRTVSNPASGPHIQLSEIVFYRLKDLYSTACSVHFTTNKKLTTMFKLVKYIEQIYAIVKTCLSQQPFESPSTGTDKPCPETD